MKFSGSNLIMSGAPENAAGGSRKAAWALGLRGFTGKKGEIPIICTWSNLIMPAASGSMDFYGISM